MSEIPIWKKRERQKGEAHVKETSGSESQEVGEEEAQREEEKHGEAARIPSTKQAGAVGEAQEAQAEPVGRNESSPKFSDFRINDFVKIQTKDGQKISKAPIMKDERDTFYIQTGKGLKAVKKADVDKMSIIARSPSSQQPFLSDIKKKPGLRKLSPEYVKIRDEKTLKNQAEQYLKDVDRLKTLKAKQTGAEYIDEVNILHDLERDLTKAYKEQREPGELFGDFLHRISGRTDLKPRTVSFVENHPDIARHYGRKYKGDDTLLPSPLRKAEKVVWEDVIKKLTKGEKATDLHPLDQAKAKKLERQVETLGKKAEKAAGAQKISLLAKKKAAEKELEALKNRAGKKLPEKGENAIIEEKEAGEYGDTGEITAKGRRGKRILQVKRLENRKRRPQKHKFAFKNAGGSFPEASIRCKGFDREGKKKLKIALSGLPKMYQDFVIKSKVLFEYLSEKDIQKLPPEEQEIFNSSEMCYLDGVIYAPEGGRVDYLTVAHELGHFMDDLLPKNNFILDLFEKSIRKIVLKAAHEDGENLLKNKKLKDLMGPYQIDFEAVYEAYQVELDIIDEAAESLGIDIDDHRYKILAVHYSLAKQKDFSKADWEWLESELFGHTISARTDIGEMVIDWIFEHKGRSGSVTLSSFGVGAAQEFLNRVRDTATKVIVKPIVEAAEKYDRATTYGEVKDPPEEQAQWYHHLRDTWIGERMLSQVKASVKVAEWQERIKQSVGEKSYSKKSKDMDMAIHLYIDTKRAPRAEEMRDILKRLKQKGMSNQEIARWEQAIEMAIKDYADEMRSEISPFWQRILDLSRNLTDEQKAIADEIEQSYQDIAQEAKDAGVLHTTLEHYVNRVWDFKGVSTDEALRKFGTRTRHQKKRKLPAILEGLADERFNLKVKGATNNFLIHQVEMANVIADREFIRQLIRKKIVMGKRSAAQGNSDCKTESLISESPTVSKKQNRSPASCVRFVSG